MSATLVLRTVKGTPLTNLEVDNNFSNLNTWSNTIDANVGVLTNLTTTNKDNVVVAVNELKSNIGVLTNLTTTDKSNLVAAINEVKSTSPSSTSVTSSSIVFAIALG